MIGSMWVKGEMRVAFYTYKYAERNASGKITIKFWKVIQNILPARDLSA